MTPMKNMLRVMNLRPYNKIYQYAPAHTSDPTPLREGLGPSQVWSETSIPPNLHYLHYHSKSLKTNDLDRHRH